MKTKIDLEDTVSEIVGQPVGNIRFELSVDSAIQYRDAPMRAAQDERYYSHGIYRIILKFTTLRKLAKDQFGSLLMYSAFGDEHECMYEGHLLQGKETEKIAEAIADALKVR